METNIEKARRIRDMIERLSNMASDEELFTVPEIAPAWKVGEEIQIDDRRYYQPNQKLYKARLAHVTQENWTPDITPNLWAIIEINNDVGTQDNPIEAARGMEYQYGLYYLDPEDNRVYLCERAGETEGNTVVLQYLPHELAGMYFVLI